jgi:hypothetical protein
MSRFGTLDQSGAAKAALDANASAMLAREKLNECLFMKDSSRTDVLILFVHRSSEREWRKAAKAETKRATPECRPLI